MLLRQVDPAEGLEIADHPVGDAVHHGDAPFARGELGFKTAETARVDGVADFANHLNGRALKENRVDVELLEVRGRRRDDVVDEPFGLHRARARRP